MSKLSEQCDLIVNGLSESEFKQTCDAFSVRYPGLKFDYESDIYQTWEYRRKVHETLRLLNRRRKLTEFVQFLCEQWPHLCDKNIPPPPTWLWPGLVMALLLVLLFVWWNQSTAGKDPVIPTATFTATQLQTSTTPMFTPAAIPIPEAGTQRAFQLPTGQEVTMVFVPAGPFLMGSNDYADNEKPAHEVFVDSFWIDLTEVTNEQFALFVADMGYVTTAEEEGTGYSYDVSKDEWGWIDGADWQQPFGPSRFIEGKEQEPVVQVSWHDATAFCEWRGAELPTEAQWEKTARWNSLTQESYLYSWGENFNGQNANFCDENCLFEWADKTVNDGYEFLALVGSYSPAGDSPYGLQDMAGNVWEWTSSNYSDSYANNAQVYTDLYVLRGGSWNHDEVNLRSSLRSRSNTEFRSNDIGFRCVGTLE